ncbi:efflux RND transporter permease subunit [Desulfoluna sp.]|uniref:efflux RND transporter permease subunit n=1 Tax=Desulfoluna sp. TaxID=2045199 RepID=UPI00260488B4|nr:efflux RND transporter permease subunit [Desulfoluna sp.]
MDLIKFSIQRPVTAAVMVIMIVLFGIIGLTKLPVQLAPDTELPEIEVLTAWPGASPSELETEVIEKQEDKLKSLQGLQKMESSSYNDYATITLTFDLSTDVDTALFRVSNKLNEVFNYPDNVFEPVISSSGGSTRPIIWMQCRAIHGSGTNILTQRTFFENEIKQYIERVEGVASLMVFGGTKDQLEIVLDPEKMARRGITINQVIARVTAANNDISAGVLGIDRRNYRIRTTSKFQNASDPMDVVIMNDGITHVLLKDIATSRIGYEPQFVSVMENGDEGIVIGVKKQKGGNVLEIVDRVRKEVDRLNKDVLAQRGLYINWSYDEAPYINRSIATMKKNVLIGAALAILVLITFLRSVRSTATIGIAIPISAIGTFISLWLMGRNLNVVSLAGISFAVGMLVDNSIVVLENIDRHLKLGKKSFDAVYEGTKEVYGAVIASTLTTVAVFLPVIFMRQEAGQLFRDIAIAITSAILLSLFVSITVIPSFMHLIYRKKGPAEAKGGVIGKLGDLFISSIMGVSNFCLKNVVTRVGCVVTFTSVAIFIAWALMPKAEYLPQGNQNFIMNVLVPPPGYSAEKRHEVGDYIFQETEKYRKDTGEGLPLVKNVFYLSADMISIFGVTCVDEDETRAGELIPAMNRIINSMPGMFGISLQPGIFETGLGKGRTIDLNISGDKMSAIVQAGFSLMGAVGQAVPKSQIRPVPSLEIAYPEGRIIPDKNKLAANGLTEEQLGIYVDVLMDGRKVADFSPDGKDRIDLVVRSEEKDFQTPEAILSAPMVNNLGQLVRVGDVATLSYDHGMTQIDRLEKRRNIRLEITPPIEIPLQEAMETIRSTVDGLIETGQLSGVKVKLGGNADKLVETFNALKWNLVLAILITYLLMAALFENFLYPFIILFSVPLAAAGGFIGLRLVDLLVARQPLDVLTMLGFIILVGTVVNNAILIVHQSLNNVRYENLKGVEAIKDAVRTRIRPIFMSVCTSISGFLPLVLATDSGSELYRGIGSVLLGGMAMSTLFTLFVIPALLSFFIGWEEKETQAKA